MKVSRPKYRWTPEMDALLLQLRGEGMRFSDIAERIGRVTISATEARFRTLKAKQNG